MPYTPIINLGSDWWCYVLYRTGDLTPASGLYRFAGYTDRPQTPLPPRGEWRIRMQAGQAFPGISSNGRAAFWLFVKEEVYE